MPQVSITEIFECSSERLWPFLDEPEKALLWMKGVVDYRFTSAGPTRVGSTFEMKIREGRRVADYRGDIVEYEPRRVLGIRFGGGSLPPGTDLLATYRLTDEFGGRTRLDFDFRLESPALWMRFIGKILVVFARMQAKRLFRGLRELVEAPEARRA